MNAATFGRWCFSAGWVLMAAMSAAWRLTNWPDWIGVPAVLLVSLGSYRIIDWLARRWPARQLDTDRSHPDS
ncbi:hypothetical protein [Micromonospora tarensis]|uniref:Uncharacterized protein n=1 Tax=Micromonospora tarensis TaxID=2806100 RepID=A0ABS1YQG8_9ACTN|nr:hypothetical protein [Micromonospora tarensis]MBM0279677.1 hypothetical protein [Micromonospora tarensis]